MKKIELIFVKIVSLVLSLIMMTSYFVNVSYANDGGYNNIVIESEKINDDLYECIYTYEKNGTKYKRIDTASTDFKNTKSEVYKFIDEKYIKVEDQYTRLNSDGDIEVKIMNNGNVEKSWIIDTSTDILDSGISARANNYDWVTHESNGSKYIGNLGRTALISAVAAIGGALIGGPIGAGVGAAAGTIASKLLNRGADYVYYHKIYNTKHCERNYAVIEETEYTRFYVDQWHKTYLGSTYTEWRC